MFFLRQRIIMISLGREQPALITFAIAKGHLHTGKASFREQGCELPVFFQPYPPSEIPDLRVREGRA